MDIQKYHSADLPTIIDRISRNSIGLDNYFDQFFTTDFNTSYPPYNLVNVSNVESRLEIALAGFSKKQVKVYTEYGKLVVEGNKENKKEPENYTHRGLAQRAFTRSWTIADDTVVKKVVFEDGLLTVTLGKIVPEHHERKDWI
tara:strand:- start:9839 stop:10267 length:429 start_codon:yes stop_codon:yes gene_type:complete